MGFVTDLITGGSKKAARQQRDATLKSAEMQANSDRLAAEAAVSAQSNMIAQSQAAARASEMLSTPQEQVDVQLAADPEPAEVDPGTGRRKTTRTPFQFSTGSAGVVI